MKKLFIVLTMLFCVVLQSFAANRAKYPEAKIICNEYGIDGCIFFNGFDFANYKKTDPSLEEFQTRTYKILKEKYANSSELFFVGYSLGGLRALAMSTYLKQKDPTIYKKLKGVITISGADKGLKLLENRGANARGVLKSSITTLSNGITGLLGILDFIPKPDIISNSLYDALFKNIFSSSVYAQREAVLCDILKLPREFLYPVIYDDGWNEYVQIRDICPQSDFIKKYVIDGKNLKLDQQLNYSFVVGKNADTIDIMDDLPDVDSASVKQTISTLGGVFTAGQVYHITQLALGVGWFTNSYQHASSCGNAADWCNNYQSRLNEMLGGSENDGLITVDYQVIDAMVNKSVINKYEFSDLNHRTIIDDARVKKIIQNFISK